MQILDRNKNTIFKATLNSKSNSNLISSLIFKLKFTFKFKVKFSLKFNFKLRFYFKFNFKFNFEFNFKLIFGFIVVISNETNGPPNKCIFFVENLMKRKIYLIGNICYFFI